MKKNLLTIGIGLLLGMTAMPLCAQVSNDNEDGVNKVDQRYAQDYVPGQVLVKFKDESTIQVQRTAKGQFRAASISKVDQLLRNYGVSDMEKLFPAAVAKPKARLGRKMAPNGTMVQEKNLDKVFLVKLNDEHADATMQLIDELKVMPEVEYAEPNYRVYITADVPADYGAAAPAKQQKNVRREPVETVTNATQICPSPNSNPLYFRQYGITQQNIHQLWNKEIKNNRRPVIAILDTGVDITHPDLEDNIWTNTRESEGERAYDDDHNGIVDDVHGWNFVDNYGDLTDRNGHGTHVAGIAAAADNNIGIVGANPLALIMPVKVMNDRGEGNLATIIQGIVYAAENGADVLNMSFGNSALSNSLKDALDNAYQTGAILVASAGNNGKSIYDVLPPSGTSYPAAYNLVLGVEASGSNLQRASFSNYDPDGPIYSEDGIDGRNYEIQVPGDKIYSTLPGGKYNQLSGTSMSAPLLAGAISALQMVKEYPSNDVLFGDLIHLEADFAQIYSNETPRIPKLELVAMNIDDNVNSNTNKDGQVDAGEIIRFYPVLRNTWVDATNIKIRLTVDNAYSNFVDVLTQQVDFGYSISAYGQETAQTPIIAQFANNIGNNTRIKFQLTITCAQSNEAITKDVYVTVNNMVKIGGMITADKTLTADHEWLVTSNIAIPQGVTLTIEPGATILFEEGVGISNSGTLIANGTPGKMITLTKSERAQRWEFIKNANLSYCRIHYAKIGFGGSLTDKLDNLENCEIKYSRLYFPLYKMIQLIRSNYFENSQNAYTYQGSMRCNTSKSNIINNTTSGSSDAEYSIRWSTLHNVNFFNNGKYQVGGYSDSPHIFTNDNPSYLGSANIDIVSKDMCDINNGYGYAAADLSNMLTEPVADAHGIVWKVVVNGYDTQDQYEQLPPLGVAKHKFEVYFNRPMNKAVAPKISFGVREPYTQHIVDEDGEGFGWNEAGTIYTAYKTINGRTQSDGVNRIYVQGAEDDEFFECPYEKTRFNINIQTAGALATGFVAEEKMGRVELTWTSKDNDFSDAMGFNIYRYTIDGETQTEPVRLNDEVILVKEVVTEDVNTPTVQTYDFTDYDVIPGKTYFYYYKVLSTDLQEYDVSNVVVAVPQSSVNGDADGSGDVKVGDVITTVNYILGDNPKPFIFELADLNKDQIVDVIDVIGIIQLILNQPSSSRVSIGSLAEAVYTIEDGILYIDTPISLAGIQVQVSTDEKPTTTKDMKGFEVASTWLTENDYRMLAYSFGSKTLTPGKYAIMVVGDADITSLRLADIDGNSVMAVPGETTLIKDAMGSKVMTTKGIYNLSGQKIINGKLPKGVYIIDGQKIVK